MHATKLIGAASTALFCLLGTTAAPAAEPAAAPTRSVSGQVLTSTGMPRIRLEIANGFEYIGTQTVTLNGVARAEQHFFVDADDQNRVRRLYWIQFEGFLPSNAEYYRYPVTKQVDIGGLSFIADTSAANINTMPARPGSDTEYTQRFLANKGYERMANDDLLSQRLVHLIGADRRNELMIIYAEAMNEPGLTAAALARDGAAADRWPAIAAGVLERASKGLVITQQ